MKTSIYLFLLATSLILACNSSQNKISQIKIGMSPSEVEGAIGAPAEKVQLTKEPGEAIEIWHYKEQDKIVSAVQFTGDEVSEVILDFEESQNKAAELMEDSREKE